MCVRMGSGRTMFSQIQTLPISWQSEKVKIGDKTRIELLLSFFAAIELSMHRAA